MREQRALYWKLINRVKRALAQREPDHAVVLAIDALHRGLGSSFGKSRADVAKACGVTPRLWSEMLYGRDAPDDHASSTTKSPGGLPPTAAKPATCTSSPWTPSNSKPSRFWRRPS